MSRQAIWTVAAVLAIVLLALILFWPRGGEDEGPVEDGTAELAAEDGADLDPLDEVPPVERTLFFPGEGGRLYGETRLLPATETLDREVQILVSTLLAGPENTSLRPPLPENVRLRSAYTLADGTVVLDLETPDGGGPPAVGSQREMLMVYSLVETVTRNVEPIERVALLWNGQQRRTLGGHLDISRPLASNPSLVAEGVEPPLLAPAAAPTPETPPPSDADATEG